MSDTAKVRWGRFCWHDMISDDSDKAIAFYTELFGWELEDFERGDGGVYKMWKPEGESTMGGFMDKPMPEAPSHWLGYVQVEDLDATLARVQSSGGTGLGPVIEVPEIGRMATIQDPQGGVIAAFEPKNEPFTTPVDWRPPRLTVCWNELMSADVEASKAFYGEVFGWSAQTQEMAPGMEYTIFSTPEGFQAAGLMQSPPPHEELTAWMSHVFVDDLAASLEKAASLGAKKHTDPVALPGIGRFALVEDPQGAFFNLFEPDPAQRE